MRHTRRKFLATTLTVLATSALSCGGGGGGGEGSDGVTPPTDVDCLSNGAGADIGGFGPTSHALRVSPEDVRAGVDKTYEDFSPSTHPLNVTLTADHFASLQANQSVTVGVSIFQGAFNDHTHTAVVSCL